MPGPLVDTDVLVDYLRGLPKAASYLEGLSAPPSISVISVAELYAGVRRGSEQRKLDAFVGAMQVVALDADCSSLGGLFRRDYGPSHGVTLTDALIAASASINKLDLVTLNKKHYPMLQKVLVPYRK